MPIPNTHCFAPLHDFTEVITPLIHAHMNAHRAHKIHAYAHTAPLHTQHTSKYTRALYTPLVTPCALLVTALPPFIINATHKGVTAPHTEHTPYTANTQVVPIHQNVI